MTLFNGRQSEAKEFFASQELPSPSTYNPADHFIWQTSVNIDDPEKSIEKIEVLTDRPYSWVFPYKVKCYLRKFQTLSTNQNILKEMYD